MPAGAVTPRQLFLGRGSDLSWAPNVFTSIKIGPVTLSRSICTFCRGQRSERRSRITSPKRYLLSQLVSKSRVIYTPNELNLVARIFVVLSASVFPYFARIQWQNSGATCAKILLCLPTKTRLRNGAKTAEALTVAKWTRRRCPRFIGESGGGANKKANPSAPVIAFLPTAAERGADAPPSLCPLLPGGAPRTARPAPAGQPYLCISPTHPRRLAGTPAPRYRSTRRGIGSQPWPGAASAAHRPARLPKASGLGNGQEAKNKK